MSRIIRIGDRKINSITCEELDDFGHKCVKGTFFDSLSGTFDDSVDDLLDENVTKIAPNFRIYYNDEEEALVFDILFSIEGEFETIWESTKEYLYFNDFFTNNMIFLDMKKTINWFIEKGFDFPLSSYDGS